jgi:hypothetical protein
VPKLTAITAGSPAPFTGHEAAVIIRSEYNLEDQFDIKGLMQWINDRHSFVGLVAIAVYTSGVEKEKER